MSLQNNSSVMIGTVILQTGLYRGQRGLYRKTVEIILRILYNKVL